MSYKWNPKYEVFCDWLFSLCMFSGFIHVGWSMCQYFIPFYCWIIVYILHFTYAFINLRTFVFSTFCCYEPSCANFCVDFVLLSLWHIGGSGIAGSCGSSVFNRLGNSQAVSKAAAPSYILVAYEGPSFSTSSPKFTSL